MRIHPPHPWPRGRTLARAAAAAVLVLAAAAPAAAQQGRRARPLFQRPRVVANGRVVVIPRGPILGQPRVIEPVNHVIDAELTVIDTVLDVPSVGSTKLFAYKLTALNGQPVTDYPAQFPGPSFRFAPGDSVRIHLVNALPDTGSQHTCLPYTTHPQDVAPNCFHGSDWTNIHYHGMHVTPDGTGDNVLLEVAPRSSFQYAFGVPTDQSPGTHWYHPHKHGSVALQVTNGMSGALLVVDTARGLDSLTRAMNIREFLLAAQQVNAQVKLVGQVPTHGTMLINGQSNPTIIMRRSEVQRWRLVNENVSQSTTYQVLFQPSGARALPKLYDIARDGVQYAPQNYDPVHPDTNLIVAPGNRLDMFVQAPADTGTFQLRAQITSRSLAQRVLPFLRGLNATVQAVSQPLLTVRVVGDTETVQTQLPQSLPPLPSFLANLPATPDTSAYLVFSDAGAKGGAGPEFWLGTSANPRQKFSDSVFISVPLNATQTWKVNNYSTVPKGINHPFHIHVNPYQVMYVYAPNPNDGNKPLYDDINAAAQAGNPYWMDTFPLPLSSGSTQGYIVVRQQYTNFTGTFVMHCHILGHEERGMMQKVQIVNGTSAAAPTSASAPAAHTMQH
ncbi:MAG TPA: multicopper oxidase family protein [Longimicrobium sp.]|nr:multicopper oxidase family protein [Longimicrobium sp.]